MNIPERKYFLIKDAAAKLGCTVEDVVHFAATGQLLVSVMLDSPWQEFIEHHSWVDGERVEGSRKPKEYCGLAKINAGYLRSAELTGVFSCNLFGLSDDSWLMSCDERCPGAGINFRVDELIVTADEIARARQSQFPADPNGLAGSNKRHISTLHKIIASLCVQCKIDTHERGAAKVIEVITDRAGVHVSDDTIRKILNELPDTKPEPKPNSDFPQPN